MATSANANRMLLLLRVSLLQPICLVTVGAGLRDGADLSAQRHEICSVDFGELRALGFESFCLALDVREILPDRCSRLRGGLRAAGRKQMRNMRRADRDGARVVLDRAQL